MKVKLDRVERAVADIAGGKAVIVVDDEDRENEGDLIFAADRVTPELVAFMVRHTSGYICVALTDADATRLLLPPMHHVNQDRRGTAYTVTVDAREGISTGISATDRARTIGLLSAAATRPEQLTRPGHVVPLRAVRGGVQARAGHTEAAVDLARLAGLRPAGALCEIVSARNPLEMARADELREFADEHDLALISIADLVTYLEHHACPEQGQGAPVARMAAARVPLGPGEFTAIGYASGTDAGEHVAFIFGDVVDLAGAEDVLVRVHSECLTGDVFGSLRCDCGPQLEASLRAVAQAGRGVIVYLRGHEGRGIGLFSKLAAYGLQDAGADTLDANLDLGLPVDSRDYATAAHILADLGVRSIRLLTNNPTKVASLSEHGIAVSEQVRVPAHVTPQNLRYLRTKRDRMGHLIELDHQNENDRTSA
jgi:3,4-dihydroxy 2-butanone 4-phosphate synthase/GTP cyclohydrolase II